MKPKNFSKKLMLNKKTVVHLDNNEMNGANGGAVTYTQDVNCLTYGKNSCPTACYTIEYNPLSAPCCAAWVCKN
ncbi:MAG: class I lanthipeptide [Acidobacteria bacterium]|nr:class I lanthipeptide [Acidobacteriota bacterium]